MLTLCNCCHAAVMSNLPINAPDWKHQSRILPWLVLFANRSAAWVHVSVGRLLLIVFEKSNAALVALMYHLLIPHAIPVADDNALCM